MKSIKFTQQRIVLVISLLLFLAFSVFVNGFAAPANLLALVRSVSVLGILGIAMAVVVIARGIDLSLIAVMAISVAWTLVLIGSQQSVLLPVLLGLAFAIAVGGVNGILVAYVEIPALFATLAMATLVYGFGRLTMVDIDVVQLPANGAWLEFFGARELFGIPTPVIFFAVVALIAHFFLSYTKPGKSIYAVGDNYAAARITGLPVRPLTVLQYMAASLVGFCAGLIMAASVAAMNTRIVNSTLIYDVILVVVLGGISLSGGKGGVTNVIVGTLLIGILLNAMTILDVQYVAQNMIKAVILLLALVIDSFVNPRDEQVAQQGDI